MKKVLIAIGIVILLVGVTLGVLVGTGVLHEHVYAEATCEKPETCIKCQKTRGREKLHDWKYATCEEPQVCKSCGYVRGEALGHDWQKATCDKPQICKACNKKKGKALGHKWKEATCSRPKTCKVCDKEQGASLGHTVNFGKCSKCGVLVNDDTIGSIVNSLNDMYIRLKYVVDKVTDIVENPYKQGDSATEALWEVYYDNNKMAKYLVDDATKIIEKCGDYAELSGIKSDMIYVRDNSLPQIPSSPEGAEDVLIEYSQRLDEVVLRYDSTIIKLKYIVETYGYPYKFKE